MEDGGRAEYRPRTVPPGEFVPPEHPGRPGKTPSLASTEAVGLWKVAGRSVIAQHRLLPHELALFDTNARMR
ncbi:hypothetical protein [Streptomyces sp. NPDC053069]|uniref:hypothetical protein n=1 Tax=Streptomyces sp. NPDC053069 TaxID=3365695 RepID=UPI0037D88C3A